jgi:hypothetical protein
MKIHGDKIGGLSPHPLSVRDARTILLLTILIVTTLLCGCSSPKFASYSGSEVFQGTGGGTERTVDGIQFWEHGEPARKYKIIGVIEQNHKYGHFPSFGSTDSANAKVAHEQGGDAIMIVVKNQESSSGDQDEVFGKWSHRRSTTLVVIKFVE